MHSTPGPHGGRPNRARRAVFISSTSVDLAEHRRVVIDTLLRLGLYPLAMEHMGSQPEGSATSVSYDYLAQADLYLGIVAWRYGYVPARETRSVTHLEYEEAKRRAERQPFPRLLFLADPSTEQDNVLFPYALRVAENQGKLWDFRAEVGQEKVVSFFTTPDDLGRKVATAFSRYARSRAPADLPGRAYGFVGRQKELQEVTALLLGQPPGQESGEEQSEMPSAVALIGVAGVGKSTLAAEIVHTLATERADRYPGGFIWARCDRLSDLTGVAQIEDQLLAAWEATLAREEVERAATVEEALALRERALRDRLQPPSSQEAPEAALVFLDNIEPGLPLGRLLQTLHPLGLQVLLTSRAEPYAQGVRLKRVDVLDPVAARSLFTERYRAAGGSWDEANEATAAAEVVGALGWLPLAIELAAARAGRNHLRVPALAAELLEPNVLAKLRDPLDPEASVRYAFEQTVGTDDRPGALTWGQRQQFGALGLLEETDRPRAMVEWTIIGVIVAIVIGFSALLYQANVFHLFPAPPTPGPTATETLLKSKFVSQDRPSCTPDNKLAPNSPWKSDGNNTTKYGCTSIGLIITQAPHAEYQSSVDLPISGPGYQPDQDYSVSVQVSQFAPPHSCAGVLVRWSGYRAYGVELCQDGVWTIFKSFASNGNIEIQQIGRFTVKKSGSYQLDVEVSHDTLSAEVEDQGLPTVTLDPTFQDYAIGLFVDGTNLKDTSIDPNSNPGASATFSNFIFTPLP